MAEKEQKKKSRLDQESNPDLWHFLILNPEKTKIMLVGTHQRTAEADDLVVEISNTPLERVDKFKYLGVLS